MMASGLLAKWYNSKKKSPEDQARADHERTIQGHLEAARQTHEHAVGLIRAHVEGAVSHAKAINKMAEPGTKVQVTSGDKGASFTKRTPKPKATSVPVTPAPVAPAAKPVTKKTVAKKSTVKKTTTPKSPKGV